MEKIVRGIVSLACLVFLIGCECSKDANVTSDAGVRDGTVVINDESLRNSAANFIANAGDRVFFAYDKSNISPEAEATLARQAEWLQDNPSRRVLIEGHCDARGTREYNLGLGERRADAAAHYLINRGISGERVRTISYGKDRPIAAQGTTEEVYRMNRVAISVIE
ncbi:MAG: OmpA family protein [Holosporaceae bacterium]|jgi:peptidoglycan-associated lipoprotein|nr:OmpA family protein [Holosporaceae bacterium]